VIEHVFDVGIRDDAMRTPGIRSKVGVMMKRGSGESSIILTMERSLRRGRSERGDGVTLSGHADS